MVPEISRQGATSRDNEFTLSIEEALQRYSDASLPRTPRSIQRYCALGHLEGRRVETSFGQKWLITPSSVDRHIAYIREVTPATSRDLSRSVATGRDNQAPQTDVANKDPSNAGRDHRRGTTATDRSRHVATGDNSDRYVSRLEGENEFLRRQITMKDVQIKDLTERARETNHLIGGLQQMLSPLLRSSEHREAQSDR